MSITCPSKPFTSLVLAALVAAPSAGCAASASFSPSAAAPLPPATHQAVMLTSAEVNVVVAAGGEPIGTVVASGLTPHATQADLARKAEEVAAARGGTHIVATEQGHESVTIVTPPRAKAHCTQTASGPVCSAVRPEPEVTTHDEPTATFVVYRVPSESWNAKLPATLRPAL